MAFDENLSVALDEVLALLGVAVSPEMKALLHKRKANLECFIEAHVEVQNLTPRLGLEAWDTIRIERLRRDHHVCQGCGERTSVLDVHHIVPLYRGGSNEIDNLITLCRDCHTRIHTWMEPENVAA